MHQVMRKEIQFGLLPTTLTGMKFKKFDFFNFKLFFNFGKKSRCFATTGNSGLTETFDVRWIPTQ